MRTSIRRVKARGGSSRGAILRRMPRPAARRRLFFLSGTVVLVAAAFGLGRGASLPRADCAFVNGFEPATLDPAAITAVPEGRIVRALFEGLVVRDPKTLEPEPGMAESWTTSPDGLAWTFKIREGARWTNGDPVTAEDFARSFERLLDPRTAAPYASHLFAVRGAKDFATDVDELGAPRRSFASVGIRARPGARDRARATDAAPPRPPRVPAVLARELPRPRGDAEGPPRGLADPLAPAGEPRHERSVPPARAAHGRPDPAGEEQRVLGRIERRLLDDRRADRGAPLDRPEPLPHGRGRVDRPGALGPRPAPRRARGLPLGALPRHLLLPRQRRASALRSARPARARARSTAQRSSGRSPGERDAALRLRPPAMPEERCDDAPRGDLRGGRARGAAAPPRGGLRQGRARVRHAIHYNTRESHRDIAEVVADSWRRNLGVRARLENQSSACSWTRSAVATTTSRAPRGSPTTRIRSGSSRSSRAGTTTTGRAGQRPLRRGDRARAVGARARRAALAEAESILLEEPS